MGLTLHPKEVDTAWAERPRGENRAEKELRREVRGRSSLTTTHVRTQERSTPRFFRMSVLLPSCWQHVSSTVYEM
jgi:hypothetical protein